jgi:hypothetical protein
MNKVLPSTSPAGGLASAASTSYQALSTPHGRDPSTKRRDYDKFSPIRQIGAQIGTDSNAIVLSNALLASQGAYLMDERHNHPGPGYSLGQELDLDSTDNLSSSHMNHSTLSPQRLHSIREEVGGRQRILES